MSKESLRKRTLLLNILLGTSQLCFANFTAQNTLFDQELARESHRNNPITFPTYRIERKAFQGNTASQITIPEGVTFIDKLAFADCPNLREVSFPSTVQDIENSFVNCTNLSDIDLSSASGLQDLVGSFQGCSSLRSVQLPTELKFIGKDTFKDCSILEEIPFGEQIPYISRGALNGTKIKLILSNADLQPEKCEEGWVDGKSCCSALVLDKVTQIPDGAFQDNSSLKNIVLQGPLAEIGERAFSGCTNISQVTLPQTVTSIGKFAFCGDTGLENISLPDGLKVIDSGTFLGCSNLKNIHIPESVEDIEPYAFAFCSDLEEIMLPDSIKHLGEMAFFGCPKISAVNLSESLSCPVDDDLSQRCDQATFIEIPEGIETIPENTFVNCPSLKKVYLPQSLQRIESGAFRQCPNLTDFVLPLDYSLSSVTTDAFEDCPNLSCGFVTPSNLSQKNNYHVVVLKGTTSLPCSAFQNCTLLHSISIPEGFKNFDGGHWCSTYYSIFQGCPNLKNVTIPESITDLYDAFHKSGLEEIDLRQTTLNSFSENTFRRAPIKKILIPDTMKIIPDGYSNIYNYDGDYSTFYGCSNLDDLFLPELEYIGSRGFEGCSSLTEFLFPCTLNTINSNAFRNCPKLCNIDISELTAEIEGKNAFDVSTIKNIYCRKDQVDHLGSFVNANKFVGHMPLDGVFKVNPTEKSIVLPQNMFYIGNTTFQNYIYLTSVRFSSDLHSIGNNAFQNCISLKKLDFPASLTSIGNNAFAGCTNLRTLDISQLTIAPNWGSILPVNTIQTVYYREGQDVRAFPNAKKYIKTHYFNPDEDVEDFETFESEKESFLQGEAIFCPRNYTDIGTDFQGNEKIKDLHLSSILTEIPAEAFLNCTNLESVELPSSLQKIGKNAFKGSPVTSLDISNLNSINWNWADVLDVDTVTTLVYHSDQDISAFPNVTAKQCCAIIFDPTQDDPNLNQWNEYLKNLNDVEHIVSPKNVTQISNNAFQNKTLLKSFQFSEDLQSIGQYAFSGSGIESAEIPDSVTTVGNRVFEGCQKLASVKLPDGMTVMNEALLYNCPNLSSITLPSGLVTMNDHACRATGISTIELPETLQTIGNEAFRDCTRLESIDLSKTVANSIGASAFYNCTALSDLTFSEPLTSIGNNAFQGCTSLTSIVFPDSLTRIGLGSAYSNGPFYGCTNLRTVTLPNSLTIIGGGAFYGCSNLKDIVFPETLESIDGQCSFEQCHQLGHVDLPDSVKTLAYRSFYNCANLESVVLPASLSTTGTEVFLSCPKLKTLDASKVSKDFTTIFDMPLLETLKVSDLSPSTYVSKATNLKTLEFVIRGVEQKDQEESSADIEIGTEAFNFLKDLQTTENAPYNHLENIIVSFGSEIPENCRIPLINKILSIGKQDPEDNDNNALSGKEMIFDLDASGLIGLEDLLGQETVWAVILEGNKYIWKNDNWVSTEADNEPETTFETEIRFDPEQDASLTDWFEKVKNTKFVEKVVCPQNVNNIGWSFQGKEKLQYVHLPKNLERLIDRAFQECSNLTTVIFPEHLKKIGRSVFQDCVRLADLNLPNSVEYIEDSAFSGCLNFVLTSLPESLKSIGDHAFYNGQATDLIFPKSCKSIGKQAFEGNGVSSLNFTADCTIGDRAFESCLNLNKLVLPRSSNISFGSEAFRFCENLETIENPLCLEEISPFMFQGCSKLKDITFSEITHTIRKYAFYQCHQLKNISLPDSVEEIEKYAFGRCRNLQLVKLPRNLEVLNDGVFCGCSNLQSIQFPHGLKSIGNFVFSSTDIHRLELPSTIQSLGKGVFSGCQNLVEADLSLTTLEELPEKTFCSCPDLTTIKFPSCMQSIGNAAFSRCISLSKLDLSEAGIECIGERSFEMCSGLKEIVWPESLTTIEQYAFSKSGLESIEIPDSVTTMGQESFRDCTQLKTIDFSKSSLTTLNYGMFYGCPSLTDIKLPHNLMTLNNDTFRNCLSLKEIEFPETLTSIEQYAFSGSGFESIEIPDSVTTMGIRVFEGCQELQSVKLSDGMTVMNEALLYNCSNLSSITLPSKLVTMGNHACRATAITGISIPETVTAIGQESFRECTNLKSIDLSHLPLTTLDYGMFYECTSLTDVNLPETLATLKNDTFRNCSSLKEIEFPETLTSIEQYAFSGSGLKELHLPSSLTTIGQYAFHTTRLEHVEVPDTVTNTERSVFESCPNLQSAKFSNAITAMNEAIFYNCPKLTSIQLPNHLQSLGAHACRATGISMIELPETLQTVGNEAFRDCKSLESIDFSQTVANSIGASAFYNCTALSDLTFSDTLTSIGSNAFQNCSSLASLVFPSTVTSIGSNAFASCTNLRTLDISLLTIAPNWSAILSVNTIQTVYYREGQDVSAFPNAKKYIKTHYFNPDEDVEDFETFESEKESFLQDEAIFCPRNYTDIGTDFQGNGKIKDLHLSSILTEIPSEAFLDCTNLESVELPSSLQKIGKNAFKGSPVTSLDIFNLNSINWNWADVLDVDTVTTLIYHSDQDISAFPNVTAKQCRAIIFDPTQDDPDLTQWNECLKNVSYVEQVISPKNVIQIPNNAFQNKTLLKSFQFSETLQSIGQYAFSGSGIESVEIPDSVITMGNRVFEGCQRLKSVKLPDGMTVMNEALLYNCPNLSSITLPSGLVTMNDHACRATGISAIELPETLQTIGNEAFRDCTKLESIDLSKTVANSIGASAFYNCTTLSDLTFSETLTSIGNNAFQGCTSLTSIVFPDSLTRIGLGSAYNNGPFYGCTNLRTVTFPNSLTIIGGGAFYKCSNLEDVVFPETLEAIDGQCSFEQCHRLKEVVLPDSVKTLAYRSFYDCANLESVVLPASLTTIETEVFQSCPKLTTIDISKVQITPNWSSIFSVNNIQTVYCREGQDISVFPNATVQIVNPETNEAA